MSATRVLDRIALAIAAAGSKLPRGGMRLSRILASARPALQTYPLHTRYGTIICDLRETICYSLLRDGEYQHWRGDEEAISRIPLDATSVVVDIGANIGVLTRVFARRAGAVHAFEPAPRALRLLRANTVDLANVTIHAMAVSDRVGLSRFEEREMVDMSGLSATGVEVPTTTIDALNLSPDFIKIDVEGFEAQVLRGAARTIERRTPVIMFEALNDQALQQCKELILGVNRNYRFEGLPGGTNFIAWPSAT